MRYNLIIIALMVFASCRQTPECVDELCLDVHYPLHPEANTVILGSNELSSAFYYNGLEMEKRVHMKVESGSGYWDSHSCEILCSGSTDGYIEYSEYKWHYCSHETGPFFYPWQRTYVAVTGINSQDSVQNIEFYSWDSDGNWNPDEGELEINKIIFPLEELEDYFIGDTIMNDIQYNDLYKVELLGVDLYYSHALGMLNTYFDPYFILVPE